MFAAGAAMSAASVVRTGVGCLELWSQRAPSLIRLGFQSREQTAAADAAQAALRDELIAVARESAEVALRELRRGVVDLDTFTRPEERPSAEPSRPYRAKP
jgi:hypothetical protein